MERELSRTRSVDPSYFTGSSLGCCLSRRIKTVKNRWLAGCSILAAAMVPVEAGTRLKELVSLEGVRENQLIGYGLVVGLNGTGDRKQTVFSAQSLANMLQQMGVSVPPASIRVNNTAAVIVTATLPAF